MEFAELTRSRRTVHSFKVEKISDQLVEDALALSLWAPNHKLSFPWVFYWTGAETRSRLAELAVELKTAKEPLSDVKRKAVRDSVLAPSHYILLGLRRSDPKREHEDYATLACSVQIASSYLWDRGVGSKWSTGGPTVHAKTYGILGVSPEEVRLEGALLIGVPLIVPAPTKRPELARVLTKLT